MKKSTTKILTIIACTVMMLAAVPVANINTAQAASKAQGTIDLKAKKLTITKGKTQKIKSNTLTMVKNVRYQVKSKFGSTTVSKTGTYKSSKPAVATVSSTGLVTAKAPGTTTIKVTYKGKTQSFKVKVVASHSHAWKTLTKATCKAKGKKLCQTCGVTGTTAKAAHNYETKTWTGVEGRGKPYYVTTWYCKGCNIDMTKWTEDEMIAHNSNIEGFIAGTDICFATGTYGVGDEERYNKYVMVDLKETYCKTCGISKEKTKDELYEVYYDDWKNVVRKSDNKIIEESDAYKNYKPYLEAAGKLTASNTVVATQSPKGANIVLEDTESDVILADDSIAGDTDIADSEEVSTDAPVISDNTAVSDNNTDITDPNGGL